MGKWLYPTYIMETVNINHQAEGERRYHDTDAAYSLPNE